MTKWKPSQNLVRGLLNAIFPWLQNETKQTWKSS